MRKSCLVVMSLMFASSLAIASAQEMPKLVQQDGRASLFVDGKPYFALGAQVDNSSGWAERLTAVWPIAERMRLNKLEVPVYWEQMEPKRGAFDFSVADTILTQARDHKTHLILLWFGNLEERQDALCPRLGEVRHRDLSAHEDPHWHSDRCPES